MDKVALNNEIVLCRAAVRKARVAVIRKLIKKIKILKSCKKEGVKDKKIKKSERLFKQVQIMKKARDDDVTKFALRNPDLDKYIKGIKTDVRQKALAYLGKHDAVMKKVNAIRQKIPNSEVELPLLLNSLGKKKKKLQETIKNDKVKTDNSKSEKTVNVPKEKVEKKKREKLEKPKHEKEKLKKPKKENLECEESGEKPKIEKVDDPFFMGKKIIAPKLLDSQEQLESRRVSVKSDRFNKDSYSAVFNAKPFKAKKDSTFGGKIQKQVSESEEKLHPSWAAKKVQLIKPFEGKKIKFSDE